MEHMRRFSPEMSPDEDIQLRDSKDLLKAVTIGDLSTARFLMLRQADVNYADEFGTTSLMAAAERGDDRMVKMLILRGANVNAENSNGDTATMIAIKHGHSRIARQLKLIK